MGGSLSGVFAHGAGEAGPGAGFGGVTGDVAGFVVGDEVFVFVDENGVEFGGGEETGILGALGTGRPCAGAVFRRRQLVGGGWILIHHRRKGRGEG